MCIECGEFFHGHCNREKRCVDCGDRHKLTDKKCEAYKYNQEIKHVMATESGSVFEVKDRLARRQIVERKE